MYHRITERSGWEGPFRGHPAQPPAGSRDSFHRIGVLKAPSSLALDVSRDGASTASLGSSGQGFTTLSVKNVFLMSSLNLPSLSLKPPPLVLLQQALLKSLSPQPRGGRGELANRPRCWYSNSQPHVTHIFVHAVFLGPFSKISSPSIYQSAVT